MRSKIIALVGVILCIIGRVTLGSNAATWLDALGIIIGFFGFWMLGREGLDLVGRIDNVRSF
jgi:uncharacterized membrane protein SpoIIM required for sporulation